MWDLDDPVAGQNVGSEERDSPGCRDLGWTQPRCGHDQTNSIATAVKRWSTADLNQMLNISTQLGQTVAEYWQNFAVGDEDDNKHQHDAAVAADSARVDPLAPMHVHVLGCVPPIKAWT